MGLSHKLAEVIDISVLQGLYSLDGSLILIYSVLCLPLHIGIRKNTLVLLEFLDGKIAQALDIHCLLKDGKSLLAHAASCIVLGICQFVLLVCICNDDLGTLKFDRCIFKRKIGCIQENGIVFFAHGYCELVHDTAVAAVEIVLGILSDKSQILITGIKSVEVS